MPYLSQVLGRPVLDPHGKRLATLEDLLISLDIPYPPVRALVVRNRGRLYAVPWTDVESLTPQATVLRQSADLQAYPEPGDDLIWLARDVLDKQIVDITGLKLVRVNDLALSSINGELRMAGVDNSFSGLLRRLRIPILGRLAGRERPRLIGWEQVDIGPAVDKVRLKVPFHGLRRMHPADIATIISQMSPGKAADVLEVLDDEQAAHALAGLSDEHQAAVVTLMEPEEAADVLEEMSPDEAADVLGDVGEEKGEELIGLMEPKAAEEVRSLMAYPDDTAGGLMDSRVLAVRESATADEVIHALRLAAPSDDQIWYLYTVDDENCLRGVISLRDLIVVDPSTRVADFARRDVQYVNLNDSKEEVARKLLRYNLLAIPVVDDEGHLQGVVSINDAVDMGAGRPWQNLPRRMLG